MNYLKELESEAIYILREVWENFENPCILYSGGKDSTVVAHIAKKAFHPAKMPFKLLHIDTGHNFPETLDFINDFVQENEYELLTGSVQELIDNGTVVEEKDRYASRNSLQSKTLIETIHRLKIDCAIGGGRRDEEKSRAKERIFSLRDQSGVWRPYDQRPELWDIFNSYHRQKEHFRVFPISNWTELDVWNYIREEKIELPSLYFAHQREMVWRDGTWVSQSDFLIPNENEKVILKNIRFRTLGDITITGGMESEAITVDEIILEVAATKISERGSRFDDKRSATAMEDRKKEGYF